MNSRARDRPVPLVVAASLVAVEGGLLVLFAVLELANLSSGRVTMGLSTAIFFLVCGAALVSCAWAITHAHSWARSPIVLAQLIQLGMAWSFRGANTHWVAVALAVVALVVVAGMFHPASVEALAEESTEGQESS